MAKASASFVAFVDPSLAGREGTSRKRTRSLTKKALTEPLASRVNNNDAAVHEGNAAKPKKRRGSAGGSAKNTKRVRVDRKAKDIVIPSIGPVSDAMVDILVAQSPEVILEDISATISSVLTSKLSKAEIFFQCACEDIVERLMAAITLDECPKVMLVNRTFGKFLRRRTCEFAPTRCTLRNLMKRQVSVDAAFLHDIMQDSGNSAGLTLRMHMILIDWLVDVAVEFHLGDATLALTAQIIGRFLSIETVEKRELQLLGVTCMWIASKMEEVSVPLVSDFAWITYDTYTTAELRAMERRVIRALQFRLSCVTPWTLVHTVLEIPSIAQNAEVKHITSFLHDLALHDPAFSTEAPGEVAAAIVYAALRAALPAQAEKFEKAGTLEYLLQCGRPGTKALLEAVVQLPSKARSMEHKLSAVLVKFRKEEHGAVANRVFLTDTAVATTAQ